MALGHIYTNIKSSQLSLKVIWMIITQKRSIKGKNINFSKSQTLFMTLRVLLKILRSA